MPLLRAEMNSLSYPRIIGLIILPSLALAPWLLLLSPWARTLGVLSDVHIKAVATITDDMRVSELANRITAISSTVLLVILALPAGVIAIRSVWISNASVWAVRAWPPVLKVWFVWFALLAVAVASSSPQVLELFGHDFNAHTIERIHDKLTTIPKLTIILKWQFYISVIAATFGGTALAAAATGILVQAQGLNPPAQGAVPQADLSKLDQLGRRLDLVLFATAAILVAGIIAVDSWSTWPSPLVAGKDTVIVDREALQAAQKELSAQGVKVDDPAYSSKVEALKKERADDLKSNYSAFTELLNGFIAIQGICYVGGLVFTFLPAAVSLDAARRRLGVPTAASAFGVDQIFRVLALLSPILVGPVAKFLSVKLGLGH
jgi:hypothetical protein